jgi:hypothetical protein
VARPEDPRPNNSSSAKRLGSNVGAGWLAARPVPFRPSGTDVLRPTALVALNRPSVADVLVTVRVTVVLTKWSAIGPYGAPAPRDGLVLGHLVLDTHHLLQHQIIVDNS